MAIVSIPRPIELGIVKIIGLPDETIATLLSALDVPFLPLKRKTLVSTLSRKVEGLPPGDIEQVMLVVMSLYMSLASINVSTSEFLDNVIESVQESTSPAIIKTEDEAKKLKQRLAAFLDLDSLRISAKTQEILHEHQHALSQVRILTDIRPVFDTTKTESIAAAVLVHTMKLTYIAEDETCEFFVAMDTSDIKILKEALERAEKKAESIKEMLSATSMGIVDPE